MATIEYAIAWNDPHCGSWYGVLSPETKLTDPTSGETYNPQLRKWQRFVWDKIIERGCEAFAHITKKDPVTLFANGDLVHGVRGGQNLITSVREEQRTIAVDMVRYFYTQLNVIKTYIAWGTEWHVGEEGDEERGVVKELASGGRDVVSTPMARVNVGGAEFSVAHHGPHVGEAHLRSNTPALFLRRRMYEEIVILQRKPADMYLYAHRHRWAHVVHNEPIKGQDYTSHLVVCPALCVMDGYARSATLSQPVLHTGMVLIIIANGKVVDVDRDYILETDLRQVFDGGKQDELNGVNAHPYGNGCDANRER
jgi:hypothetical protein